MHANINVSLDAFTSMQVSRDAVPWGLIFTDLNKRHECEMRQLMDRLRPIITFIVKETGLRCQKDRSGVRDVCKWCCEEGWVTSDIVEEAIKQWSNPYPWCQPAVDLFHDQADWLREDVRSWSSPAETDITSP